MRHAFAVGWSADAVLEAVASTLSAGRPCSRWSYERADLDGDHVLIVFEADRTRFGVSYGLTDLPRGPNTGEPCETPEDWARELLWDLDEQVDTGGVARAEQSRRPDGLVLLKWRW